MTYNKRKDTQNYVTWEPTIGKRAVTQSGQVTDVPLSFNDGTVYTLATTIDGILRIYTDRGYYYDPRFSSPLDLVGPAPEDTGTQHSRRPSHADRQQLTEEKGMTPDAAAGNKGMTVLRNIVRTVCILVSVAALLGIMPAVEMYGAMNVFATIMLRAFSSFALLFVLYFVVLMLLDIFS